MDNLYESQFTFIKLVEYYVKTIKSVGLFVLTKLLKLV